MKRSRLPKDDRPATLRQRLKDGADALRANARKTIAFWRDLLTVQRHRITHPRRLPVADFIRAGEQEPRILEVLPAAVKYHPERFVGPIPKTLRAIINGRSRAKDFHGVPIERCNFWLKYPTPESYYRDW